MSRIELAEFAPDIADYNVSVLRKAENVLPRGNGYASIHDLQTFTGGIGSNGALNYPGVLMYNRSAGGFAQYTIIGIQSNTGSAPQIYVNGNACHQTSGLSAVTQFRRMSPVQWDTDLIMFGAVDPPQIITESDLDTLGTNKSTDLGGSPPAAEVAARVRHQLVVGRTYESSTLYRNRLRWSAFGDPEGWTNGTNQAGQEEDVFAGGGDITAIVGGEYGLVLQENQITRMNYIGAPSIWEFDVISEGVGCPAGRSVVKAGDDTYFLSHDGFKVIRSGSVIESIGANKFDKFVLENAGLGDTSFYRGVSGAYNKASNQIFWLVPKGGETGSENNTILVYDIKTQRATTIDLESTLQTGLPFKGVFEVEVDYESTDDEIHRVAVGVVSSNTSNGANVYTFEASGWLDATFETGEIFDENMRTHISMARPIIDCPASVALISKDTSFDDTEVEGSAVLQDDNGKCDFDDEAKVFRLKLTTSGQSFKKASAIVVTQSPAGEF